MTFPEFDNAMLPLKNRFKSQYNGDVLVSIFDAVKSLDVDDFKRIVPHLNGRVRTVPLVPEFEKAMAELNIRPQYNNVYPISHHTQEEENFLYCIREEYWADNTHIFIRGPRPGFIIKKDHPAHPMVIEDSQVRSLRISEIKKHLTQNTYSQLMTKLDGLGIGRRFPSEGA